MPSVRARTISLLFLADGVLQFCSHGAGVVIFENKEEKDVLLLLIITIKVGKKNQKLSSPNWLPGQRQDKRRPASQQPCPLGLDLQWLTSPRPTTQCINRKPEVQEGQQIRRWLPLRRQFVIVSKRRGHATWRGPPWEAAGSVRRQRKVGELWARAFVVVSMEGTGEAGWTVLGLAHVNKQSSRLWGCAQLSGTRPWCG